MRQAFKDSTVWFYQVLARKTGHDRMQKFVEQSGYGNRQIGEPDRIDRFWLEGPLQITPKQQIEFLQRFWIVGYLEQNDNVYFFATNILMPDDKDALKRLEVTRRSFTGLGLL